MVSRNDPIESLLSSFQVVKDAFAPIELGIKKATKDIGPPWWGSKGVRNNNVPLLEEVTSSGGAGINNVKNTKVHLKKKNRHSPHFDEARRKGSLKKLPMKIILGMFLPIQASGEYEVNEVEEELQEADPGKGKESCFNCLPLAMTWPAVFLSQFGKHFQGPFKLGKKQQQCSKLGEEESFSKHPSKSISSHEIKKRETKKLVFLMMLPEEDTTTKSKRNVVQPFSLDLLIGLAFAQLTRHIPQLSKGFKPNNEKGTGVSSPPLPPHSHLDHWKPFGLDIGIFLGNLKFARVGGMASSTVAAEISSPVKEDCGDGLPVVSTGSEESEPQKLSGGLLNVPLSKVERLKSTLSHVSITELIELIPQFVRSANDVPDKKKLFSVQDFFRYTESEGRRFFEELDRNGDGQVCLEDLEIAMRKRKLPRRYAREFMRRARSHLFAKSFGWNQFLNLMEQKEPTILRAYTSLCLTKSGTLQKSEIMTSLENAGLPANEDNAVAMMRFLNADTQGSISYGHFRNFMLLLPSDRLLDDPRNIWFEAATVVPVAPPVEMPAGSVLRSALAGGLASGLSTSLLHPVDTIKTRVQTSTLSFPEVISRVPQIGVQGLYRGFIPAILGQFTSHGLRTGIFEASKLVLINVAPNLPDIQVQSMASFCSTLLGTATRIPCEVLKQRLQAGLFENVGEAIVGTWQQDGLKGFFRGTGVTLCREVPLYVAGMGLYAESKKLAEHLLHRELDPWETIAVGALSGGIAAVLTTPFDVLKTRMMTAPHGRSISTSMVVISILSQEGPLGFFKGAVPRFFWVAPVGAMNFAGYELAKKAMTNKSEDAPGDESPEKKNY